MPPARSVAAAGCAADSGAQPALATSGASHERVDTEDDQLLSDGVDAEVEGGPDGPTYSGTAAKRRLIADPLQHRLHFDCDVPITIAVLRDMADAGPVGAKRFEDAAETLNELLTGLDSREAE
jgi:hypothetical protein